MAMERQFILKDTHTRTVTAIGFNPVRREINIGYEDGVIKTFESETGKLVNTYFEHKGWITDFIFWHKNKFLLSSANDAQIIFWGTGGTVVDVVNLMIPIYCMVINPRRNHLIIGVTNGVKVYCLDNDKESGHYISTTVLHFSKNHTDIVKNIACHESRVFSAGYDQRLVIYDSSFTGSYHLTPVFNKIIHDAGISCLVLAKDSENNAWLCTGSFDKTMKIWSLDGKLIHKLDCFLTTITGICYVPRTKTVWTASDSCYPSIFDPKSGDNVTDFVGSFASQKDEKCNLQMLKYFPELNQLIASSSRRHLVAWKYSSSGCITTLTCESPLESLCYTLKVPILLFSGDHDGHITKWERMQSNHIMYSKEIFDPKLRKTKDKTRSKDRTFRQKYEQTVSQNQPQTIILKMIFVEDLDIVLAASEDGTIQAWGFDDEAVEVLSNMKPEEMDFLSYKYSTLLDSQLTDNNKDVPVNDSVTNRVAGFVLKYTLAEHFSCVSCLQLVSRSQGVDGTYLLSGGWDRRICLWDLESKELKYVVQSDESPTDLACDDVITDMDFSPNTMEFAYSCADKMVYIRKLSTSSPKMKLVNTLQGHEAEVTCVRWNAVCEKWITGSEDETIRIWSASGVNECELILSTQGPVTCLCIDQVNGAIVAGIQNNIRVFESELYQSVQANSGHTDCVRSIIHVPERNQYVSCGWDNTIRVWNAWKTPPRRRPPPDSGKIN